MQKTHVGALVLALLSATACSDSPPADDTQASVDALAAPGTLPPITGDGSVVGTGGAGGSGSGPGPTGGGAPGGFGFEPPPCLPAQEVCDAVDNDCDGQVDEVGCACTAETSCYEGPVAARGVGACADGMRGCDGQGEFFGPCAGSVLPSPDLCDGADNDCDGRADESCCALQDCPDANMPPVERPDMGCPEGTPGCPDPLQSFETFTVGESVQRVPVDYLMVVDNSGSMDDTVAQVEANLGAFATRLVEAGLDYRFVLIAERGVDPEEPDVCIPPPMAGPGCSDTDRFRHLDQHVNSHDAFEHTIACADGCDDEDGAYRDFLRPGALLQILAVTDDESDMSFGEFQGEMAGRGFDDFTLHGVVGLRDDDCVAGIGAEYINGAQATGGEVLHICEQNWGQVIQVLFDATLVQIQSVYPLMARPEPASLRVYVTPPGLAEIEAVGTWDYDPMANAIVFRDGAAPLVGSLVTVWFDPA